MQDGPTMLSASNSRGRRSSGQRDDRPKSVRRV